MRVVFDSDSVVYMVGFAAQTTSYDYILEGPDGEFIGEGLAESMTALKGIEALIPGAKATHFPVVDAEPLHHALHLVKRTLVRVEEDLDRAGLDFDKLELFLTGPGNYRESLATIKGYKANRIGIPKPVHYKAIRRYLKEKWGAQVVRGYEADDKVAMVACENDYDPERCCIVSADKDLLTVPGRLYNFQSREMKIITEQEARVAFYRQILMGDTADNIAGCFKVGPKAAEALITEDMPEAQMVAACLAAFDASLGKNGCPYRELGAYAAFLETGRLVHMARHIVETNPSGYWGPPV